MTRARKAVGRHQLRGGRTRATRNCSPPERELSCDAAEVVFLDPDVTEGVASLAADTAEVRPRPWSVGPDGAKAALAEARNGSIVVRLLAGDPLATDEGVREVLAAAAKHGRCRSTSFPGVGAAVGTAAYAGVPRSAACVPRSRCMIAVEALDFDSLAAAVGTLVLTLPATLISRLGEQLVAHGLKPDTGRRRSSARARRPVSRRSSARWARSTWPRPA